MEIRVGDVVRLKKKHPCGCDQWQVFRVGADVGIKCRKCRRGVFLERAVLERRVRGFVAEGVELPQVEQGDEGADHLNEYGRLTQCGIPDRMAGDKPER